MARPLPSPGRWVRTNAFSCLALCHLLFIVVGAVVFTVLEEPVEAELRAEADGVRSSFLQENPCVEEAELRQLLGKALSAHHGNVPVLEADEEETHYDFTSSLYFVILTLTTMGSDSYSPKSDEAKLFCVVYCAVGIPSTLFVLSVLSHLLLPVLTHLPLHHLHTAWGLSQGSAALLHAGLLTALVVVLLLLLPALLLCSALEPDWSFLDALFFCFVVLSTVGEGGKSPGGEWGPPARDLLKVLTTWYLLLGLVVIITLKDTVLLVPQVRAVIRLLSGSWYSELEGVDLSNMTGGEDGWAEEEDEEEEEEERQYAQSICTISSSPPQTMSPCSDFEETFEELQSPKAQTDIQMKSPVSKHVRF